MAWELWNFPCVLYDVMWVMPNSVKDLFVSWMGGVKYAEFSYVEGYPDVLDVVHMEGVQH